MNYTSLKRYQLLKHKSKLKLSLLSFICDPGGIQTPNRWSRNPVLYSVELQSLFITLISP